MTKPNPNNDPTGAWHDAEDDFMATAAKRKHDEGECALSPRHCQFCQNTCPNCDEYVPNLIDLDACPKCDGHRCDVCGKKMGDVDEVTCRSCLQHQCHDCDKQINSDNNEKRLIIQALLLIADALFTIGSDLESAGGADVRSKPCPRCGDKIDLDSGCEDYHCPNRK